MRKRNAARELLLNHKGYLRYMPKLGILVTIYDTHIHEAKETTDLIVSKLVSGNLDDRLLDQTFYTIIHV